MNKTKKAVDQLRQYLGRDSQGLRMLEEIASQANGLRKELAAAQEKMIAADDQKKAASASLLQAQLRIADIERENIRLQSIINSQQKAISTKDDSIAELHGELKKTLPDYIHPPSDLINGDTRPFVEALNALRRELRVAPKPRSALRQDRQQIACYELTDIVANWSAGEMQKLGRFVACMALANLPCSVQAEQTVVGTADKREREKVLAKFVYWFRNNISTGGLAGRGFLPRTDCNGQVVTNHDGRVLEPVQ